MSTFYRYLHPLSYNFKRNAVETNTKGGICFRVTDVSGPDNFNFYDFKVVDVSYSVCDPGVEFNKDVAKKIADNRTPHRFQTESLATNMIAHAIIDYFDALPKVEEGLELYQLTDLQLLKERIQQIWATHRAAWQLDQMDRDTLAALDLVKFYESQSR